MNPCCSLLRLVIEFLAINDFLETAHDCSLDHTDAPIYIVVFNARDQSFFSVFDEVILNNPYVLNTADVLIELWVDGHVFGTDCESFTVFVLRFNVQNERNARRELSHQLLKVLHVEMDPLYYNRFISKVRPFDYLSQLLLDQL